MKERRKSVLVVEDEVLIGEMVCAALADDGFDVHVSHDARDALRYLKSGKRVDVLFTDIDLPGGMDGGSLAREARELRPGIPVVYASGKANGVRHTATVPGSIFLQKPYDPVQASFLLAQMSEPEDGEQEGGRRSRVSS
ncbi:MAG TPA: response regulator [Xanthobacteraceae bacterium]|nr:response regulator [Xanthobacteraceae bacterium]